MISWVYDDFKHKKDSKINAIVNENSMPLSIELGLGNEYDSKNLENMK